MQAAETGAHKGICYVVMGFGKKTDFETGRTLDLDKTYRNIIKPAVEAAGLECLRADEIAHSGLIDALVFRNLLRADFVIVDLSTWNRNAFYELGLRHALRPATTIVICDDGTKHLPFDHTYVTVRKYHHLGEGIDYGEVQRFRAVLTEAIVKLHEHPTDSPVYTLLKGLRPPVLAEEAGVAAGFAAAADESSPRGPARQVELMEEADEAQRAGDFGAAKLLLTRLREEARAGAPARAEDPYIIQRLALVTYKSKVPTPPEALEEARALLLTLNPATTNDPETLGLWGAVHKRLWELTGDRAHLDESVRAFERGFYLRNDYYNGINLAYLLNVRASNAATRGQAVTDFIQAERVRREVIGICDEVLGVENLAGEDKYWVLATKAEALLGVGDEAACELTLSEANAIDTEPWMTESTLEQLSRLRGLLAESPLRYVRPSFDES